MGVTETHSIKGQVRLILREVESGEIVEERGVKNIIMTKGSELVAKRFCGEPVDVDPIAAVGVGGGGAETSGTVAREPVRSA